MNDDLETQTEGAASTPAESKDDTTAPAVEAKKPSLARSALAVRTNLRAGPGKADLVNS